jgi:thioredoxin reductase (NADPH)
MTEEPRKKLNLSGLTLQTLAPVDGAEAEAIPAAGRPAAAGEPVSTRVVIVGSGPAGLTAAVYAGRANLSPVVIGGLVGGGQLMTTSDVENYPGFPEGIQGPELMERFRAQALRFGATIVDADVERVDFSGRPFRLWAEKTEYRADAVIVATGADAIWLGIESETRLRGKGVSACATCDGFFFRDRVVGVVGGGDSALEDALYLTRFAKEVHLIHRRDALRASKIMQDRAMTNPKVRLHLSRTVKEVLGGDLVEAVKLEKTDGPGEETLPLEGLFVAIGHRPNTGVFKDWLEVDQKGYLSVDGHTTASNIDGIFIAGDVDDHRYRQAVTAAGEGCRAAIDAERWLEATESAGGEGTGSVPEATPAAGTTAG